MMQRVGCQNHDHLLQGIREREGLGQCLLSLSNRKDEYNSLEARTAAGLLIAAGSDLLVVGPAAATAVVIA